MRRGICLCCWASYAWDQTTYSYSQISTPHSAAQLPVLVLWPGESHAKLSTSRPLTQEQRRPVANDLAAHSRLATVRPHHQEGSDRRAVALEVQGDVGAVGAFLQAVQRRLLVQHIGRQAARQRRLCSGAAEGWRGGVGSQYGNSIC